MLIVCLGVLFVGEVGRLLVSAPPASVRALLTVGPGRLPGVWVFEQHLALVEPVL